MKMKQPELGKKIAELRKAKGLTQEELVEKCNINVRTLQRIESGEATPRSYTLRVIFTVLDFESDHSIEMPQSQFSRAGLLLIKRLEQFYRYFIDLFNLKTNTMKKVTILSVLLVAICIGLFSVCTESKAQTTLKVKKVIGDSNKNFVRWFNNGQIDSLASMYRNDASLVCRGSGRQFIKEYYMAESRKYKFKEIKATEISVCDTLALEKGRWSIVFNSGEILGGEYLSEWRLTDKNWMIVNELSGIKQN
jgi:transcriptional regulator with XRE-family HTH domain